MSGGGQVVPSWYVRRKAVAWVVAATVFAGVGCGGGGDGGGTTNPPNNTPAQVTLAPTGALTVASGSTSSVTATVLTSDGRVLSGQTVNWNSSSPTVATVTGGVITGVLVGNATITASVGSITSPGLVVTVTPGPPTQLGVRTQPAGASVASAFTTQPVVEIRDAAGNVVTSSALQVTTALASGGGTLTGNTSVVAVSGIATFSALTMTGTAGPRTLSFTATGVAPATSASFALAPGAPAQALITRQPGGGGAVAGALLAQPIIGLRDVGNNVATGSNAPVTASVASGIGTVGGAFTVNAVAGIATFTGLSVVGAPGDYTLGFSAPGVPLVTSQPLSLVAILYGLETQKVQVVNVGEGFSPSVSSGSATTFRSSAASRATVDNTGRFTGRGEGQSWIAATNQVGSDSILAIVPRGTTGPIFRSNLTTFALRAGAPSVIDLVVDPRGTQLASFSLIITLNTQDFSPAFTPFTVNVPGASVTGALLEGGVMRMSVAASTPITAPTTFGRINLTNGPVGARMTISITAIDAASPDGASVYPIVTSTYYPLIFR